MVTALVSGTPIWRAILLSEFRQSSFCDDNYVLDRRECFPNEFLVCARSDIKIPESQPTHPPS
ncbi:hypothetical protein NCCP2145_05500 [Pseudarthrobacter sp. NCCP-2145]|nr:hypothetical protein NCCP2145_05500 [Pseudarthrobacter sp. NCCP-2145]